MKFEGLAEFNITRDLIDGYAIRRLSGFDVKFLTLTNFFRAHGTLTYGDARPTVVLSSSQILRHVIRLIIPAQRPRGWDGPFKRGFKIAGSPWWPSLIPEVEDGWVVLLNEDHPLDPRLNGCFKVGKEEKPLCDTTMTPRNPVDTCVCIERTDEMGPCDKFEVGGNGRCVYCDHEKGCHPETMKTYEFLSPAFLEAMNDIGRYGHEKYGAQSFQHRRLQGDTSRGDMERTRPGVIGEHVRGHYQMHLDGVPHDHFKTRRHQIAAAAFNCMMEAYFAGLEDEPLPVHEG